MTRLQVSIDAKRSAKLLTRNSKQVYELEKKHSRWKEIFRCPLFCSKLDSLCSVGHRIVSKRLSTCRDDSSCASVGSDVFNSDKLIEVIFYFFICKDLLFFDFVFRHFLLIGALICFQYFCLTALNYH